MSALVKKEFRLLGPAWVLALVLAAVPVWLSSDYGRGNSDRVLPTIAYWLGLLSLAVTPFGRELNAGTLSWLLVQPTARQRVWRVKAGLLAAAVVSVLCAYYLSCYARIGRGPGLQAWESELLVAGLSAAVVYAGGLWTTLLFRQVAAAFWFTLIAPGMACVPIAILSLWFPRWWSESVQLVLLGAALVLYAIAGFWLARRMFLCAEDVQWTGGTISVPWRKLIPRLVIPISTGRHGPFVALLLKEFQLHQVTLLFAAVLFLAPMAILLIRAVYGGSDSVWGAVYPIPFLLLAAVPLLAGCEAVAEERKLGTLDGHLCLPVRQRWQFMIKIAAALMVGTGVSLLALVLAQRMAAWRNLSGPVLADLLHWRVAAIVAIVLAGITAISFYASTLARSTLHAVGIALALATGAGLLRNALRFPQAILGWPLWNGPLVQIIGWPTMAITVAWLAAWNYRHVQVGWSVWRRNLIVVAAALGLVLTATAGIYNRVWELFTQLEPHHGLAQLSGTVRPKICFAGAKMFALLPDGRLWAEKGPTDLQGGDNSAPVVVYGNYALVKMTTSPFPRAGGFVGRSNWVDIAASSYGTVGIQSDGSLWCIFEQSPRWHLSARAAPPPQRFTGDSDWRAVAGGADHFLALKADGTIWGWGNNQFGQLGPNPKKFTNDWVRIGTGSNWVNVFASGLKSWGVKRDGTAWEWGLGMGQSARGGWGTVTYTNPVQCGFQGTNWIAMSGGGGGLFELAVNADGSAWAVGRIPGKVLGTVTGALPFSDYTAIPRRVGSKGAWGDAQIGEGSSFDVGLGRDGRVFENDFWWARSLWEQQARQVGKHSDWIAIGTEWNGIFAALAADGTVCFWQDRGFQREHNLLLGPTRKPVWSLNILTAAKP